MQWSRHSPLSIIQACQNRHLNMFSILLNATEKCMFVNQLMAKAMMEMVEESEVQSRVTQQLINVFRDSVAKKENLAHMLMGVIRAEVADCDVVDR